MTFEYLSSDKNHPQALKTTAKHTTLGCQVRLEALMSTGEWKEGIAGISNLFSFQQEFNAQENFCKDESSSAFKTAKDPCQCLLENLCPKPLFRNFNTQKRFRFMKYL